MREAGFLVLLGAAYIACACGTSGGGGSVTGDAIVQDAVGPEQYAPDHVFTLDEVEGVYARLTYCWVQPLEFQRTSTFGCILNAADCDGVNACVALSADAPVCTADGACPDGPCGASEHWTRCEGDALVWCYGDGQQYRKDCTVTGARCVLRTYGQGPNDTYPVCGFTPGNDLPFTGCEGDVAIHFDGFNTAGWSEDCTRWESEAHCSVRPDGYGAQCAVPADQVECDPYVDRPRCDVNAIRYCPYGRWRTIDCAAFRCGTCEERSLHDHLWDLTAINANAFPPWFVNTVRAARCLPNDAVGSACCTTDAECGGTGRVCLDGACARKPCTSKDECAVGQTCAPLEWNDWQKLCTPIECAGDGDCASKADYDYDYRCDDGACVAVGHTADAVTPPNEEVVEEVFGE